MVMIADNLSANNIRSAKKAWAKPVLRDMDASSEDVKSSFGTTPDSIAATPTTS